MIHFNRTQNRAEDYSNALRGQETDSSDNREQDGGKEPQVISPSISSSFHFRLFVSLECHVKCPIPA